MSYTPWPVTLPQTPKRQGFSRGPLPGVAIFEPEAGPAKRRRRHTADGKTQPVVFEVTGAQATIFEAFFDDDLGGGTLPFLWQGPRDTEPAGWVFNMQGPWGLSPLGGDWWDLSMNIERLP